MHVEKLSANARAEKYVLVASVALRRTQLRISRKHRTMQSAAASERGTLSAERGRGTMERSIRGVAADWTGSGQQFKLGGNSK